MQRKEPFQESQADDRILIDSPDMRTSHPPCRGIERQHLGKWTVALKAARQLEFPMYSSLREYRINEMAGTGVFMLRQP